MRKAYEISFKTIQKYCKHRRDNLDRSCRYKYRCSKIILIWGVHWDIDKDSRCTQTNCPIVKRLWKCD